MHGAGDSIKRWTTVLLTIAAWLCLSNHCALGLSSAPAVSSVESNACPMHSAPTKEKPAANVLCCKILRATVAAAAKSWARDHTNFSNIDLPIEAIVIPGALPSSTPLLLDTGPPGKTSFVQLIGGVRAHAPPSRV